MVSDGTLPILKLLFSNDGIDELIAGVLTNLAQVPELSIDIPVS